MERTEVTIVHIKENSWLATLAARKLRSAKVAMVLGNTIHLHHTTKTSFLSNKKWVCHELTHVQQYRRYGFVRFIFLYLIESIRKGYHQNKFEMEARQNETNEQIMDQFIFP